MDSILQIKQSQQEARVPVTVFELEGELDASNYDQFLKEAMSAVESGAHYVLLDLSRLKYISSAGLRALYTLQLALSERGSDVKSDSSRSPYLKLCNPSKNVHNALDMLGFTTSIDIYNDYKEALASF